MKIYWNLYFNKFSNDKIMKQKHNPLREYVAEIIDGPIIDIGCGQSALLLEFSGSEKFIYAIDNEQEQLDYLSKRLLNQPKFTITNWSFLKLNFPDEAIPQNIYSLIILSNILHFFSLQKCKEIIKDITNYTTSGSLIYIEVHSDKFYANNPENPENNLYYKHYFNVDDLNNIFIEIEFERIYLAEIEKKDSIEDKTFVSDWLDEVIRLCDVPVNEINNLKKNYLKDKSQSDLIAIFKKK